MGARRAAHAAAAAARAPEHRARSVARLASARLCRGGGRCGHDPVRRLAGVPRLARRRHDPAQGGRQHHGRQPAPAVRAERARRGAGRRLAGAAGLRRIAAAKPERRERSSISASGPRTCSSPRPNREGSATTPARTRSYYRETADRLRTLPGVEAVTFAATVPLSDSRESRGVIIDGHQGRDGSRFISTDTNVVATNYFDVIGIPIVQGRGFVPADGDDTAAVVAVVNETMAQRYWPDGRAVGQQLRLDADGPPVADRRRRRATSPTTGSANHRGRSSTCRSARSR